MSDLSKRDIVEIIWTDAYSSGGWETPKQLRTRAKQGMRCTTVGYLLSQDDQRVAVVQTTSNGKGACLFVIPAGCVTEVRLLKRKKDTK